MSSRYSQSSYMMVAGADGVAPLAGAGGAGVNNLYDGVNQVVTANFNTVPVFVARLDAFGIQFTTFGADSLVGTLTLQASAQRGREDDEHADAAMVNAWVTLQLWDFSAGAYAASKAIATGANSVLVDSPVCGYRWVRAAFAFTSGSGHPQLCFQQKGYS